MKAKLILMLLTGAISIVAVAVLARPAEKKLVVHEWGTFTSLQGDDGKPIPWKPLKTLELPKFVYDWHKPEPGLWSSRYFPMFTKGEILSLQRMETPVIYFYSDHTQTVDVLVKFPQGYITEWYPRATQVGPSQVMTDRKSDMTISGTASKDSLIRWSNLHISPSAGDTKTKSLLPNDSSGSHYFAARETDADFVQTTETSNGRPTQQEKFLFYRGVADFISPLRISMPSGDIVVIANTGKEPLSDLFVLGPKDKSGNFVHIPHLLPGEERTLLVNSLNRPESALAKNISGAIARSLVNAGLYKREADAMVKTWKDSWFAEDGLRVLYILPQSWTERTLPMSLNPSPKELVRVMVGRAEVLRPGVEQSLVLALDRAKHGDPSANDQLRAILKSLGRFAEPALNRAFAHSTFEADQNFKYASLLNQPQNAN